MKFTIQQWRKTVKKQLSEWVIVTQSCLTLCDPLDCSLPGSSVHGILQARITRVDWYFLILPSPALGLLAVSFDLTPIKKWSQFSDNRTGVPIPFPIPIPWLRQAAQVKRKGIGTPVLLPQNWDHFLVGVKPKAPAKSPRAGEGRITTCSE